MISQYGLCMSLNYQKLCFLNIYFFICVGTQFMYESESHSLMSTLCDPLLEFSRPEYWSG